MQARLPTAWSPKGWLLVRRKLSLARNIKCEQCAGRGTKSGKQYPCSVRLGTSAHQLTGWNSSLVVIYATCLKDANGHQLALAHFL